MYPIGTSFERSCSRAVLESICEASAPGVLFLTVWQREDIAPGYLLLTVWQREDVAPGIHASRDVPTYRQKKNGAV